MQFAGVGAGPMVHEISPRMRAVEAQRRMMRALRSAAHPVVQGARPEFQMFNPAQMHGMGEYFAANGLGADQDVTAKANMEWYGAYALGGAVVGLLGAAMLKKSKLAGTGFGVAAGLGLAYLVPPTVEVVPVPST
jgi:hypothetical protein